MPGARIEVDYDTCEGLGMCESMADDYFDLGDDDQVTVPQPEVPEADRGHVHAAVEACPVLALRLVEEDR